MKKVQLIMFLLLTTSWLFAQSPTTNGVNVGTEGDWSTYIGQHAGMQSTGNADFNTFIGGNAGRDNEDGTLNVYAGLSTGRGNKGSNNVFLGAQAGRDLSNTDNTLIIENSPETVTPLIYGDFATGKVGIETSYVPDGYAFAVNGNVLAEEVQVMIYNEADGTGWPDYVFAEDYKLMPLTELETTIEELGHLPGVPSAEEVEENGHALGKMDAILLEKVEELTLHLIEMNKEMKALRQKNQELENKLNKLEK